MKVKWLSMGLLSGFCRLAASAVSAQTASTWDQIMTSKKLRLGCAPAEPWCFKDVTNSDKPGAVRSGETVWRGVSVNLGKAIADAMGVELEVVETTWGNAVAALQANQFDFKFVLDATPQRALAVDFVGPMLWYPIALLVKEDFKPTTWEEMSDPKYSFGAPLGTNFVGVLQKYAPKANIKTFQQSNDVIAAFQAGRIDGATGTGPNADTYRMRLGMGKTIVPKPAIAVSTGGAVRKEQDRRWRDYLQVAVNYFYETGRTQEFYEQFLTFRGLDPKTAISTRREDWK
jgi:polar amino acid transport system substrate-binding protein